MWKKCWSTFDDFWRHIKLKYCINNSLQEAVIDNHFLVIPYILALTEGFIHVMFIYIWPLCKITLGWLTIWSLCCRHHLAVNHYVLWWRNNLNSTLEVCAVLGSATICFLYIGLVKRSLMGSDRYKVCFYNEKKQTNDMILAQMYSAGGIFFVCDLNTSLINWHLYFIFNYQKLY